MAQHLCGIEGALAVSPMLTGKQPRLRWPQEVLGGQGITLGAARGSEEGPAQLQLARLRHCSICCQCPEETTPQRPKQPPLSPCLAAAQAKERAALL